MTISKAQIRATAKYQKENYDEIKLRVPKGKKEVIQNHAKAKGETVNGFVTRAINETLERESTEGTE